MPAILNTLVACAMCNDMVAGFLAHMARGYFWSILLMLSMPCVLVSVIAWRVIRAARRREIT